MDPNATLAKIIEKMNLIRDREINRYETTNEETAAEAVELLEYLGEWIRKGGALPDEWKPR